MPERRAVQTGPHSGCALVREFDLAQVGERLHRGHFPAACLVVLAGLPGSGKSTLAQSLTEHDSEIVGSDWARWRISDRWDQHADQDLADRAFSFAFGLAGHRCDHQRFTIFDSLALRPEHRKPIRNIAIVGNCPDALVLVDSRPEEAARRNLSRDHPRRVPPEVWNEIKKGSSGLWEDAADEGWSLMYRVDERFDVLETKF